MQYNLRESLNKHFVLKSLSSNYKLLTDQFTQKNFIQFGLVWPAIANIKKYFYKGVILEKCDSIKVILYNFLIQSITKKSSQI